MTDSTNPSSDLKALARRHLRIAWAGILVFVTLGLLLESLHALKIGFYLDVGNETRRLMWTLAHAHGLGLCLLQMGFAATLRRLWRTIPSAIVVASNCLTVSTVLIPLGFLLGGVVTYGGDPGLGALLVPIGGIVLWIGVLLIAREAWRARRDNAPPDGVA